MIDSATINYAEVNNNKEQNNNASNNSTKQETENNDNSQKTDNIKDNTVIKAFKLPQTGTSDIIIDFKFYCYNNYIGNKIKEL